MTKPRVMRIDDREQTPYSTELTQESPIRE